MTDPEHITYARHFQDVLGLQVVPLFSPIIGPGGGVCRCRDGADCASPGKHPKTRYKGQPSRLPMALENYAVVLDCYVVVDIDDRDVIGRLPEVLGFEVPDTWAVDTGKGRHLWFKHTEPLATRLGAFPKVDLKSGNTYVVGPGSRSVTGTVYSPINSLPIAAAPEALVKACGRARLHRETAITHKVPMVTSHFAMPAVDEMCETMRTSQTRNNTLLQLSCYMLRSGWAGEDALRMLADAAMVSGLTEAEVLRTQDSARRMVTLT